MGSQRFPSVVVIAVLWWTAEQLIYSNGFTLQTSANNVSTVKPQQIHISLGDTAKEMTIMWATIADDVAIVQYHTGDHQKVTRAEGQTIKFETTNKNGANYIHRVSLQDLVPQTQYFYHVGGEDIDTFSDQYSFVMPPAMAGNTHTFMVYAELGAEIKNLQFLLQETLNEKYEAIFHIGVIAYNLSNDEGQAEDKFLNQIEKVSARIPYMTVPGDHERYNGFLHYRYKFSMPNLPWPMPVDNLWYSIDIGPIHFVIYSTEVFFFNEESAEVMLSWLKSDLDKANSQRSATPWIIAIGHRPMYCSVDNSEEDCQKDDSLVRMALEELFYGEGVDLILSGHQHFYERSWPTYNKRALKFNYKEPAAPVHITMGTLGSAYLTEHSSNVGGQWSAFLSDVSKESFGRLKIFNATHLYWEVRECANNKLIDKIWIIQPFHRPFNQQKVYIPNPFGAMRNKWMATESSYGLESFLGMTGTHYGDDFQTKLTVLTCVFVICILGLISRKKVLTLVRLCCFKKESCKKLKTNLSNESANV